jgi:hypothetical protein
MEFPESFETIVPESNLSYFDQQSVDLKRVISCLEAWNMIMFNRSDMLRTAFKIRDVISARFGVRPVGGFSGRTVSNINVGENLDFFLVEKAEPYNLVLTVRDRHLDVMVNLTTQGRRFSITTSVKTHNLFGKVYMVPVGVVHRQVVRGSLRDLKSTLEAGV